MTPIENDGEVDDVSVNKGSEAYDDYDEKENMEDKKLSVSTVATTEKAYITQDYIEKAETGQTVVQKNFFILRHTKKLKAFIS